MEVNHQASRSSLPSDLLPDQAGRSMNGKHGNTESEATATISLSSPRRSPPRQAYFVQSPTEAGDSRTIPSYHSSPARSPPFYHGSGSWGSSTADKFARPAGGGGGSRSRYPGYDTTWQDLEEIEEERLIHGEREQGDGIPARFYVLGFVGVFLLLFFLFALILWGASHDKQPLVTMNSITIGEFNVQAGTDSSLVPTNLVTLNSTVKLSYRNTGGFFGVHVTSTPVLLNYYQLTIASGSMQYFYQSRKSQRELEVAVVSTELPVYGGGAALSSRPGSLPVNLTINFTVRSRAFVLGRLVQPKFYNRVECALVLDQTRLGAPVSLKNSCQHTT
ncbi:uncharacterized protein LOC122024091 [Zingiber officinale]|uniref:Late embryogenesis abundant protein LEA-2 subgroup domain-containing protein n=1 Tax=Zingiber officinale TaxID=94328 RepID=A0A8J5EZY6_ZINOF|nr:uncharacterized protein LOC122024091 [Zingiber officinale]KAG6475768.1 hypothetical protein ZIOFF_064997 [Zingiber officinale]